MSASQASNVDDLERYVGRTERVEGRVEGVQLDLMAAIFDRTWQEMAPDDVLPPLWHWLLLQSPVRRSEIGVDGHPKRGGFLPPIALPRRMFAGARVEFLQPLVRGDAISRTATIKSIVPKSGRSGDLVFVTVAYEIAGPDGLALREEQDIVYREPSKAAPASQGEPGPELPKDAVVEGRAFDPVGLFRFSAATGNAHRIHYDRPYATTEEGYPDLVVHGPLQAIWLADLARRNMSGRLSHFSFQGRKPAFVNMALRGVFMRAEEEAELSVIDDIGSVMLSAKVG